MIYTNDNRITNSFCEMNVMEQEKIIEFIKKNGIQVVRINDRICDKVVITFRSKVCVMNEKEKTVF